MSVGVGVGALYRRAIAQGPGAGRAANQRRAHRKLNRLLPSDDYSIEMDAIRRSDRIYDEALVLHAQAGRREALERLASRWLPRHYAHARRLLGTSDWAADAVQDAWIGIIRGLCRLKDPARFPAWSYAIVTRRCQDLMRRASHAKETQLDESVPHEAPDESNRADELVDGLNSLSPDQRAAIALFYRDGFTVSEIAEALRIPVGTVKTRLFHARRALRRYLAGDES